MAIKFLFALFPPLLFAEIGYVEPWGTDRVMIQQVEPPHVQELSPLAAMAEKVILFHQNVLTHTTGPRSHFRPSSSHYALEAIRKRGFLKGYFMGCDRLLRENSDPWIYETRQIEGTIYKWDPSS